MKLEKTEEGNFNQDSLCIIQLTNIFKMAGLYF